MWSLGVVAYEMLTGRRPFEGDSDYATIYKITHEEPVMPTTLRPGLPPEIDRVLMRALAKHPEARFKQWMDFAESMLQVSRGLSQRKVQHREGEAFARMRELPFFAGFPDSVLWEALRLGTLSLRPAETVLMQEGTAGDSFLVLLQGQVAVMRGAVRVATLDAGVTLGEMAYLRRDEPQRTATAVAATAVLVLEILNQALRSASDDLQMCFDKAFIDVLLQRLMKTTEELRKVSTDELVLGGTP
jgi:CRP-like cAMP-binding protein